MKKMSSSFQESRYPRMQEYSTLTGWTTANSPTWSPARMLSQSSSQVDRTVIRASGGDLNQTKVSEGEEGNSLTPGLRDCIETPAFTDWVMAAYCVIIM